MYIQFLRIICLLFIVQNNFYSQFTSTSSFSQINMGTNGERIWVGDFNGDSMSDILKFDGTNWFVSLSIGTSFINSESWLVTGGNNANKYYIGDFNGDGMTDIAAYWSNNGTWKVALASQNIQSSSGGGNYPQYSFLPFETWGNYLFKSSHGYYKHYIGDFDGDGDDDIMSYKTYSSGKTYWKVAKSTGDNFGNMVTWRKSYDDDTEKIFIADIDGDGDCDLLNYRYSDASKPGVHNLWYISQSSGNNFGSFNWWNDGQGSELNGPVFGDIDGDGDKDKIYLSGVTGQFWISESQWVQNAPQGYNSFGGSIFWWSSGNTNIITGYAGDFNGDKLSDVAYLTNSGMIKVGLNISPRPTTPDNKKIVATWFVPYYQQGKDNGLYNSNRDPNKIPKVGWNSGTITGYYNSGNASIIDKQIDAMIECGINLIIVDNTNGWNNAGTVYIKPNIDTLFQVMSSRPIANRIPIAIALGYEYWGKETITAYGSRNDPSAPDFPYTWKWDNIGWNKQYDRQNIALNSIYNSLYLTYPDIYYKYLGSPLVITYLENGYDYPPKENDGSMRKLWNDNRFTLIPAINWHNSFGWFDGNVYRNGQYTKKTWGWGSWWFTDSWRPEFQKSPPYNEECTSIMPGAYIWHDPSDVSAIRNGGQYYIDSWMKVVDKKTNIILIGGWNNWNEGTAIEGCVGSNGWKDLNGNNTFDWYLQITHIYTKLFKEGELLPETYFRKESGSMVYYFDGTIGKFYKTTNNSNFRPNQKPIVKISSSWLVSNGYFLSSWWKKNINENNISDLPTEFGIEQNYPNPFNPISNIKYSIKDLSLVRITVLNTLGEEVALLVNEVKDRGSYEVNFNASNLASGIYLYKMEAGNFTITKKMMLLK